MNLKLFRYFLLVITIIISIGTHIQDLMGIYFLNRGISGLIIAEMSCSNGQIDKAKANLQLSLLWNPNNPYTHRVLGRAFLYDWQVDLAYESIQTFSLLTSSRLWADIELNSIRCAVLQEQNGNITLWRQAGITGNKFMLWFVQSLSSSALGDEGSAGVSCQNLSTPVVISDTTILTGKDLGEFNTDDRIKVRNLYQGRKNVLAIYANRTASKTIIIEESAQYEFNLLALNSFPSPVIIGIEMDNEPVGLFSFDSGDETWTDKSQKLFLEEGIYLLGVSFLNDEQVRIDGQTFDRNMYIASLSIQQLDLVNKY